MRTVMICPRLHWQWTAIDIAINVCGISKQPIAINVSVQPWTIWNPSVNMPLALSMELFALLLVLALIAGCPVVVSIMLLVSTTWPSETVIMDDGHSPLTTCGIGWSLVLYSKMVSPIRLII